MRKYDFKKKLKLHPIMTIVILIFATIVLSGILGYFDVSSNYLTVNPASLSYETVEVSVDSLFNPAGVKYIFSNTVANFVNFAPLSTLIIVLIGIGVMEKSGFLQAFFTIITKFSKKYNVTFFLILSSIIATITGEIIIVFLMPIGALLFKYGKRNPLLGIIASYAGATSGLGINILINSTDSLLMKYTELSARVLDPNYTINTYSFLFIMVVAIILISLALTYVTENYVAPRLDKYEIDPEIEEYTIGKRELRGIVIASLAGIVYLLFFVYNVIPGLPLSGSLLDKTQTLYIDKLFGTNTFFSAGFVFIFAVLFVILGLFYGIGSKTIKNNKDFSEFLSHSLNKVGNMFIFILLMSAFISVFKRTYIGNVLSSLLINTLVNLNLTGIVLIIVFLLISIVSAIVLPSTVLRWSIFSGIAVRVFMDAGMTPEFAQLIFRIGESISIGLTPLFAYFVIYLGFFKAYKKEENSMTIREIIKKLLPYSVATALVWVMLIILWYFVSIPLGINTSPFL